MIIQQTFYPKLLRPFNNLIIDWATQGIAASGLTTSVSWTLALPIGFGGTIIRWNNFGVYGGWGTIGQAGGTPPDPPGSPITATIDKTIFSNARITISAYNDGTVVIPAHVSQVIPYIVDVCRYILKTAGAVARPYQLLIKAGDDVVFTVPSVYFGSRQTAMDGYSDIEVIRGQSYTGQAI